MNRPTRAFGEFTEAQIALGKKISELVGEGLIPQQAVMGTGSAGALPYYSNLITVDLFGLNDPNVASFPVYKNRPIGHQRQAPLGYLRIRKVAILTSLRLVYSSLPSTPPGGLRVADGRVLVSYEGTLVPVFVYQAKENCFLAFASVLSDAQLKELFHRLKRIDSYDFFFRGKIVPV